MIVDGKAMAADILRHVKEEAEKLPQKPIIRAIAVVPNAATESFLRIKSLRAKDAGMELEIVELPEGATTEECIAEIEKEGADAVIVQLPLPSYIDTERVLNAIPVEQDADVLSSTAYIAFENGKGLVPPVVSAVAEILKRSNVSLENKKVVVIGEGKLVGKPAAIWAKKQGANVSVVSKEKGSLGDLQHADVIISGAGSPHVIRPNMIAPGVVLIDAGTSESQGELMGDSDPLCVEVASVFSPVPGGVGPIVVAMLFANVLELVKKS